MDNPFITEAKKLLDKLHNTSLGLAEHIDYSITLSKLILQASLFSRTAKEKKQNERLAKVLHSKALISNILDSCFRSKSPKRIIDQLLYLLETHKIPKNLVPFQNQLLFLAKKMGKIAPRLCVQAIQAFLKSQMHEVILPGEKRELDIRLQELHSKGIKVNLNRLGEAILGEKEAENRINDVLQDLGHPHVSTVSVKISSIYSHVNPLSWDETLTHLKTRFRTILRQALRYQKTVYLDMEEYKDLQLTSALFTSVLSEEEFLNASAGIALQSYIPESYTILEELIQWAAKRQGSRIKIRIVKGANLGMERVEASIKGLALAPYTTKQQVDENFKKMLQLACSKIHAPCIQIAVASHNLFDIAYAMIIRQSQDLKELISFEMLSGMAPHISRVVQTLSDELLLYCPAAKSAEFHTAMAYLMRRLDENSAPDNFLTHLFSLKISGPAWQTQSEHFINSCLELDTLSNTSRRTQNRLKNDLCSTYNVPDTDWSQKDNRSWARSILQEWQEQFHKIPLVINGEEIVDNQIGKGFDPSVPNKQIHSYCLASSTLAEIALQAATTISKTWAKTSLQSRITLLHAVGATLQKYRSKLIGAMIQESAKTMAEADTEVSEAVDFAFYLAKQLQTDQFTDAVYQAAKVVLVTPPWNFPVSIPTSALLSSLITGHSVIFKPAPQAVLSGWILANALWDAGISKQALQFISCLDEPVGSFLVKDPRIDKVILTGSTETARLFLQMRPDLTLFGETGGKNAIIVTSMADRDLAVRDIVQSSFSYAGQKCSACSLLILEEEVYNDKTFRKQLEDATKSLIVGSSWQLDTQVPPLITKPSMHLLKALTTLENNEYWCVEPKQDPLNPQLWSPGIKYGVQEGSFMHQTEFFGPVLSVMCAKNLHHAIQLANGTAYGLTAGIHSLDPREQKVWLDTIQAGNCYINRGITGAIVGRQPFGGCKASSFGIGMKVGGPHYLLQLLDETRGSDGDMINGPHQFEKTFLEMLPKQDIPHFLAACRSYHFWHKHYFAKELTLCRLVGQDNTLHFRPRSKVFILLHKDDSVLDSMLILSAALICGCDFICGSDHKKFLPNTLSLKEALTQIAATPSAHVRTLRMPEMLPSTISCLDMKKPSLHGRIELIHYMREVSISKDYHRYGNLMERENEFRDPVL